MALLRSIAAFVAACSCGVTAIHADCSEPLAVGIRLRVDPSIASQTYHRSSEERNRSHLGPRRNSARVDRCGSFESPSNSVSLDASLERQFETRLRMAWPATLGRVLVRPDMPSWQPIRVSFDATERVLAFERRAGRRWPGLCWIPSWHVRSDACSLTKSITCCSPPLSRPSGFDACILSPQRTRRDGPSPFRLTCGGVVRLRVRLSAFTADAPSSARFHNARYRRLVLSGGSSAHNLPTLAVKHT